MPVPVLKSACGCCSVNVGAKVLAWIDIVFFTLKIAGSFSTPPPRRVIVRDPYSTGNDDFATQMDDYSASMDSPMSVIPISLVMIAAGVLVLIGIEKRRKTYLMPYLILKGIGAVVIAILVIIFLVLSAVADEGNGIYFAAAIVLGLFLALTVYFWLWVYSVHQQLQETETEINTDVVKYTCPPQGEV